MPIFHRRRSTKPDNSDTSRIQPSDWNAEHELAGQPVAITAPSTPGQRGPFGPPGAPGQRGPTGPHGPQGSQGPPGRPGPQGTPGPKGDTGPTGHTGDTGPQGAPGTQGQPGRPGSQGEPGQRGNTGQPGPSGPRGVPGATGPPGAQGNPGPAGQIGPPGPFGPQGPTGPQGPSGSPTILRKTSDQIVNNSTVFVNANDLSLAVAAGQVWFGIAHFLFLSGATPDIKFCFTYPSGGKLIINTLGSLNPTGGFKGFASYIASGDPITGNGLGGTDPTNISEMAILFTFINGASAGTLQPQFAQNTANASDTKLLTNSIIQLFQAL